MDNLETAIQSETMHSLLTLAEELQSKYTDTRALLGAIRKHVLDHAQIVPIQQQRQPKSIIESRFTLAQEAFDSGMTSCGALTNIAAQMMRHLGYEVRLVHGENEKSVDHAWVTLRKPGDETWIEYDLTRPRLDVPTTHLKKEVVEEWEDIRPIIQRDQETMFERRRARGLLNR